jgi:hypothetical protein
MNLTDYVIEWIFDSTAGKYPIREILVSLNEHFGSRDCLRRSRGKNLAKLK